MGKLMDKIIKRTRHLIVEEADVTKTLRVIQEHHKFVPDMAVGNCGWDDETKWFIHFAATNAKWEVIRHDLGVVRVFTNKDIPENANGVVYTTD